MRKFLMCTGLCITLSVLLGGCSGNPIEPNDDITYIKPDILLVDEQTLIDYSGLGQ